MSNSPTLLFVSLSLTIISYSGNTLAGPRVMTHGPTYPGEPTSRTEDTVGPPSYSEELLRNAKRMKWPPQRLSDLRKELGKRLVATDLFRYGGMINRAIKIYKWTIRKNHYYEVEDARELRWLNAIFDDELTFKWMKLLYTAPHNGGKEEVARRREIIVNLAAVKALTNDRFQEPELKGPKSSFYMGTDLLVSDFPEKVFKWLDAQIDERKMRNNDFQHLNRR